MLLFFGFSPIKFVINTIKASYSKTEIINLYAYKVAQDKEPETYEEGWWNLDFAAFSPQIKNSGSLLDFTDENSSFYTGGDYSLNFSHFRFLEEDVGLFSQETESDLDLKDNLDQDNLDIVVEDELKSNYDELPENNTSKELEVIIEEEVERSFKSTVNNQIDNIADINEEEIDKKMIISDKPFDILADDDYAIYETDFSEKEILESSLEDEALDSVDEIEVLQNEDENEAEIKIEKDKNEPDLNLDISLPEDNDEDLLSFGNYFDSIFNSSVQAEEMLASHVENLSDLGVFKSATIKLSMAINETGPAGDLEEIVDTGHYIEDSSIKDIIEEEPELSDDILPLSEENIGINNLLDEDSILEDQILENDNVQEDFLIEENQEVEIVGEIDDFELVDIIEEPQENEPEEEAIEIVEEENTVGEVKIKEENEIDSKSEEEVEKVEIKEENKIDSSSEEEAEQENKIDSNSKEDDASEQIISWFNFVKIAQAQSENIDDVKIIIWYSLGADTGLDRDRVWHQLDTLGGQMLVNSINGDYFSYEALFLKSWEDIDSLEIKIEAKTAKQSYVAYLDSVWVETEYEPSDLVQKINKRKEWEDALQLISDKIDFKMDERGVMKFHYQKNRETLLAGVGKMLGLSSYWQDISIGVSIVNSYGQEMDLPLSMIFEEDGDFEIRMPEMPRGFQPGKYQLRFYIEDSTSGELETIDIRQDFTWGVLAFNSNKSVYVLEDDSAFLQMAVLDNFGRTLCDAELALNIVSPNGLESYLTTNNGQIVANPECGPDNVIDTPDYYAFFMIDEIGEYKIDLIATTTNGVYHMKDKLIKSESQKFDVERVGPTRIYPLANYNMNINIKANENFSGPIFDYVPSGFEITTTTLMIKKASTSEFVSYNEALASSSPVSKFRKVEYEYENKISWDNIELKKGDELFIDYEFDAPDISPEFYLLGALEIADFTELRQWQIASDAIAISTSTNGSNVGWTDALYAWDNTDDTYAYRDIPRKSVDDSANYIQSYTNSSVDLGGDITSVEVGIEGYVEYTTVTAYITPYFNGSTAGTLYSIAGTTLGTSDDDTTDYVDITTSSGAPTTWTWSDIQNLDIRIYGNNTSNSADSLFYIDQIRIRVNYTPNTPPDGSFISANQREDDTGIVDIAIRVEDIDDDDSRARLDYVSGSDCDFSTPLDATLDETDANATSTVGDANIDNNQIYQIGTSTGWITMANASNTVFFDWLSASNTADTEGVYCLRLTANDQDDDDATPATTTLVIDNKAPSQPGIISGASSTKNSIMLFYGTASTDLHFKEYRIYYATSSLVDENDYLHSSTTDANLGDVSFNNAATTTIFSLLENTIYYFVVWAYDDYGHKSSSSVFSFATNKTPIGVFTSASPAAEKTDGSGVVDISIDVGDLNNDDSRAKIEYVQGSDCNFATPLDPTLDENSANISSTYGLLSLENDNEYQVGNSAGWILTPATNTVAFDWNSVLDLPNANDTYCLRLTANDQKDDQNISATTTLVLDNLDPTAPGSLSLDSTGTSTLSLIFGATSTETNFSYYKIYYKAGTSGVTESDTEHTDSNLSDILYNGATTTTIIGLSPNTDYVINIWVYDSFGNISSSTEVSFKTDATVLNNSLTFVNPAADNWAIADGVSEFTFEAVVSEDSGWNVLNNVVFRLADADDNEAPFSDLEFSWSQTTDVFSEIGSDVNSAVSLATSSSSSCAGNTCTLDFNLIFNHQFATSSVNYSAELFSTNDSAVSDEDTYLDFYQIKIIRVEQVHYRWRNDDGGE